MIYMNGIYQGFGPPEGVWRYIYNSDIVGWTDADLRDLGNIFVSYKLPSVVIYIYIYMAYVQPAVSSDLIYACSAPGRCFWGCCHYYIDTAIDIEIVCTQVHDVRPECLVPVKILHKSWATVCGVVGRMRRISLGRIRKERLGGQSSACRLPSPANLTSSSIVTTPQPVPTSRGPRDSISCD
jgi:hypothetical protein